MWWTLVVGVLMLWILGFGFGVGGTLIHLLPVVGVTVLVLLRLLQRRLLPSTSPGR